ncbi:Zinc-type alcohol dehydrogenase protein [Salix suchowensis]|nr:Zinc-type alcohol dehydrogenase protein [Salix suchowensis]
MYWSGYRRQRSTQRTDIGFVVESARTHVKPSGYKMMRLLPNFMAGRPLVVEHDFAGVVEDANDTEFKAGDPVFGFIHVCGYSSTIRSPGRAVCQNMQLFLQLRLLFIPYNRRFSRGWYRSGRTNSLSGTFQGCWSGAWPESLYQRREHAVGLFAIQIAKAHGMTVVASASSRNEGLVREMGANESNLASDPNPAQFIDYTKEPLHQYLASHPPEPKFHAIIDAFGLSDPSLYTHSPQYLAPQGIFVTTGPFPHSTTISEFFNTFLTIVATSRLVWLGGVNRKYKLAAVMVDKADLNALSQLVAEGRRSQNYIYIDVLSFVSGKLKGVVDSVYSMEDALKGYERLMTSRAAGKVVIEIDPSVQ